MTRKTSGSPLALAALLLCWVPAAAQTVGWDEGRDVVDQFGAQLKEAQADPPAPPASAAAPAAPLGAGLVVDATEIGVGKFHRYDNEVHPYPGGAWVGHISPAGDLSGTPIVFDDADGAVTIQFSSLEELLRAIVDVSQRKGAKVSVLNIHGHGLPGAMWFPKDEAAKKSAECAEWRRTAAAKDEVNYKQYYTTPSKSSILGIRRMSKYGGSFACTTGAPEWTQVVPRVPGLRGFFADDAQIHFQSCVVGLGPVGDRFTKTVAALLLAGKDAGVQTALSFGLGDWSMPEGMGFWDYVDDAQLARDARLYDADRNDREVRQNGSIRVAVNSNGDWTTTVVGGQAFMTAGAGRLSASGSFGSGRVSMFGASEAEDDAETESVKTAPSSVRVPGTDAMLVPR